MIPARYDSSRFPGKPLALINGQPLVQHVWEAARRSRALTRLVVATDDDRVASTARGFGAECVMTGACASGTDRAAEVARRSEEPMVLVIQGDEPLLEPAWLDALVEALDRDPSAHMSTLRTPVTDPVELDDPNVVKVACRPDSSALYFSRSRIPYHNRPAAGRVVIYKHVGLYGYRRDFLLMIAGLPVSELEQAESLEQLRALEAGARIVVPVRDIRSIAVDRPADVGRVEAVIKLRRAARPEEGMA